MGVCVLKKKDMGVDYFPCKWCKTTICDCGPFSSFTIKGIGRWSVCEDCAVELRSEFLTRKKKEPNWTYFILPRDEKEEGTAYSSWSELQAAVAEREPETYRVGLVKRALCYVKPRLQDALLRRNGCGGMKEQDVQQLCASLKKDRTWLYAGWRGHRVERNKEGRLNDFYSAHYFWLTQSWGGDSNKDPEQVLRKLRRYREEHDIPEDTPFLVTRDGASSPECDNRDISFFACPEQHHDTRVADSLEELDELRWEALDPGVGKWLPTPAFVEILVEKGDKKRRRCKQKMKSLKKLCVE